MIVKSKPRAGAALNWGHPLSQSLCGLWIFNEGSGKLVRNLTGGSDAQLLGSSPPSFAAQTPGSLASDPFGHSVEFVADNFAGISYMSCGTDGPTTSLGQNPATFFVRFKRRNTLTTGGLAERNDGNTVSAGWILGFNNDLRFIAERSNTNCEAAITMPSADVWHNVIVVYDASNTAANYLIYLDGVLQSHSANTNGIGTTGSDAANLLYFGRKDGSYFANGGSLDGAISTVAIWKNRFLTQQEAIQIELDPWCYLRRPSIAQVPFSSISPGVADASGTSTVAAVSASAHFTVFRNSSLAGLGSSGISFNPGLEGL